MLRRSLPVIALSVASMVLMASKCSSSDSASTDSSAGSTEGATSDATPTDMGTEEMPAGDTGDTGAMDATGGEDLPE